MKPVKFCVKIFANICICFHPKICAYLQLIIELCDFSYQSESCFNSAAGFTLLIEIVILPGTTQRLRFKQNSI